jgi:hypothetical protein
MATKFLIKFLLLGTYIKVYKNCRQNHKFYYFCLFFEFVVTNPYIYESAAANLYKNSVLTNLHNKNITRYLNRGPPTRMLIG